MRATHCLLVLALALNAQNVTAQSLVGVYGGAGYNETGTLGSGAVTPQKSPVAMLLSPTVGFVKMSAGYDHACGLDQAGYVWCWGANASNQVGSGASATVQATPFKVKLPQTVTSVHAGFRSTCAILVDTTARCWGSNGGRLGNPAFTAPITASNAPVEPGTSAASFLTGVIDISIGMHNGCAVASNGGAVHQVYCWGENFAGQLGIGSPASGTETFNWTPTAINTGKCTTTGYTSTGTATTTSQVTTTMDFKQVSVTGGAYGQGSVCALNSLGAAFCWGDNSLGTSGAVSRDVAVSIGCPSAVNTSNFTAPLDNLYGPSHTQPRNYCARATDGSAYCWGYPANGNGTNSTYTPVPVQTAIGTPLTNVSTMAVGISYACAARWNGAVYCWGDNLLGEFGNGNTTCSIYAVPALQGNSLFKGALVTQIAAPRFVLLAGAPHP
jgi:alpha-tubulin suppressor-like RCC1 family protein